MEQHKASMTAIVSAFARAYHAKTDQPVIFNDNLAYEMVGEEQYQQIAQTMQAGLPFFSAGDSRSFDSDDDALKWIAQTHLSPTPIARARYCEDMLANAIQLGVKQYVILGAGLDTFAFRNPDLLEKVDIFELDHPATQSFKRERIQQLGWTLPENYHLVPIDFTSDNLSGILLNAGFEQTERTYFSWLGVTYYLSQKKISDTLTAIAAIAPQGSSLMFDYPDETLFQSNVQRVHAMRGMAEATGEGMKSCFSYSQLENLLERSGFLIYEHLSAQEIDERYFQHRKDDLHAFETVQFALAVLR